MDARLGGKGRGREVASSEGFSFVARPLISARRTFDVRERDNIRATVMRTRRRRSREFR